MIRYGLTIEAVLEEILCQDTPPCNYEHWRDTSERRPGFFFGPFEFPLPGFMLGWTQRRCEARQ